MLNSHKELYIETGEEDFSQALGTVSLISLGKCSYLHYISDF
jgi:hypothetical protein